MRFSIDKTIEVFLFLMILFFKDGALDSSAIVDYPGFQICTVVPSPTEGGL